MTNRCIECSLWKWCCATILYLGWAFSAKFQALSVKMTFLRLVLVGVRKSKTRQKLFTSAKINSANNDLKHLFISGIADSKVIVKIWSPLIEASLRCIWSLFLSFHMRPARKGLHSDKTLMIGSSKIIADYTLTFCDSKLDIKDRERMSNTIFDVEFWLKTGSAMFEKRFSRFRSGSFWMWKFIKINLSGLFLALPIEVASVIELSEASGRVAATIDTLVTGMALPGTLCHADILFFSRATY